MHGDITMDNVREFRVTHLDDDTTRLVVTDGTAEITLEFTAELVNDLVPALADREFPGLTLVGGSDMGPARGAARAAVRGDTEGGDHG